MTYLLRLDSSARAQGSHSRDLADYFQTRWTDAYPDGKITVRDVTNPAIPHVTQDMITAFQSSPDQQTTAMKEVCAVSDQLIAELKAADYLLISVPMYNFSVPSTLKAWIDQIVRDGETFTMSGESFAGLLQTKKAFICTAYGAAGYREGGPFSGINFLEPYLQCLLGFLSVQGFQFFAAENMMAGPEVQEQVKAGAKAEIEQAIAALKAT